jgi:phosphohistidine phosphatase
MNLFILRHAEAVPEASSDAERPLTERGTKQAKAVGRFCRDHEILPELVLSSPLVRAHETARVVAVALELVERLKIVDFLKPAMGVETVISSLEKYADRTSIMLVGHEPDLSELASVLLGSGTESLHIRKGTLLRLSLPKLKPGAGTLEFLLPVKLL